jgi:hypothetical protein
MVQISDGMQKKNLKTFISPANTSAFYMYIIHIILYRWESSLKDARKKSKYLLFIIQFKHVLSLYLSPTS